MQSSERFALSLNDKNFFRSFFFNCFVPEAGIFLFCSPFNDILLVYDVLLPGPRSSVAPRSILVLVRNSPSDLLRCLRGARSCVLSILPPQPESSEVPDEWMRVDDANGEGLSRERHLVSIGVKAATVGDLTPELKLSSRMVEEASGVDLNRERNLPSIRVEDATGGDLRLDRVEDARGGLYFKLRVAVT